MPEDTDARKVVDLSFTTDPAKARNWKMLAGDASKVIDALFQRVEQLEAENAALREELTQFKKEQ